jgi:hypothetical protein
MQPHRAKVQIAFLGLLFLATGPAFAGAGAPMLQNQRVDPPPAVQGAVLDEAKCKTVWSLTERQGDTLSQDKAAPFIVNFQMVDTNNDGKITQDEFLEGCKKALVQEQASLVRLAVGRHGNSRQSDRCSSRQILMDWDRIAWNSRAQNACSPDPQPHCWHGQPHS